MKLHYLPSNWTKQRLKELVARFDSGVSVNGGDRPATGDECGVLKVSSVSEGKFLPRENKILDEAERKRARLCPKGDRLIMSRANTPEFVGASAYIDRDYPNLYLSDKLWQFELREGRAILMRWLGFLLSSPACRQKLREMATGSSQSMKNISKEIVLQIELPVPPLEEQQLIVRLLEIWDTTIDLTERLIAEKLLWRKGLLQQLLTGKRRLPGFKVPWKILKIKETVTPVQRQIPKPTQPYDALGIRSHFKGTFAKQVEDPEKVDMDMLYIAKAGDLIVNITFAWEGAIAIVPPEHDGRLVSHRFPTYRPKEQKVSTNYLGYLITQDKFKYLLSGISPGGAGRNRVMSKKDFLKLEVFIPDLDEQEKIAEFLDIASREIDLLRAKVDALREQKKGLLQQLLTGKKRVKI
jgi:type I restriction enzyme S subunit